MNVVVFHKASMTVTNWVNVTSISKSGNIITIVGSPATNPSLSQTIQVDTTSNLVRIMES